MRIELHLPGTDPRAVAEPYHGADHAIASGACPECAAEPFKVAGSGIHAVDDRRFVANGFCLACHAFVGRIVAIPDTLFGIAEDERVLHGRCRVY